MKSSKNTKEFSKEKQKKGRKKWEILITFVFGLYFAFFSIYHPLTM